MEDIYFVTEAAKRLGIHPSTLRDIENRGLIQVQRNWVGWRVYPESQIEEIKKVLYPRAKELKTD